MKGLELRSLGALLAAGLFASCGAPSSQSGVLHSEAPPPLSALLPKADGAFGPSRVEIVGEGLTGELLADVETCGRCHQDVIAQWRTSAHAFASFQNPIYRVSVDRLRKEVGKKESRFCGGCHDISLLVDGVMDG